MRSWKLIYFEEKNSIVAHLLAECIEVCGWKYIHHGLNLNAQFMHAWECIWSEDNFWDVLINTQLMKNVDVLQKYAQSYYACGDMCTWMSYSLY